ncbi:hypothetical protein DPMN_062091 [Dreissena polymorpha]|uniref:Uncharacterized protein n=1 Tax=Dreissena polymorpha TaxID=45954 RepID=A0A9D4C8W9_DREPO|nr:hypothetical protein DPMN_062091 [Dreissena polymorpha]
MYVRHLVALVERESSRPSYEIQLLDISTGPVCYVFDEFKLSSSRHQGYWPVVYLCKPNRISTCKKNMKVIVADEKTIYRFNIEDGECDTVYAVGICAWSYDATCTSEIKQGNSRDREINPQELKKTVDVKCDSQGNMYAITNHGLYQLHSMSSFYLNNCSVQSLITCFGNKSLAIDEIRQRI